MGGICSSLWGGGDSAGRKGKPRGSDDDFDGLEGENTTILAADANRWAKLRSKAILAPAASQLMKRDPGARQKVCLCCGCDCTLCWAPFFACRGCLWRFTPFDFQRFMDLADTEVEAVFAAHQLTSEQRQKLSEHALFIGVRQRILGENNFVIMSKPMAREGAGSLLTDVTILRAYRGLFGYGLRRFYFDARTVTNVELYDEWNALELFLETIILIFAVISYVIMEFAYVPEDGDPPPTDGELQRKMMFRIMLIIAIVFLTFVVVVNYLNTFVYRGTRLVIDTGQPGTAFVNSRRAAHRSKGVSVKTHGSNSAHMYIVTLDPTSAQHAAMYLNQWKRSQQTKHLVDANVWTEEDGDGGGKKGHASVSLVESLPNAEKEQQPLLSGTARARREPQVPGRLGIHSGT